MSYSCRRTTYSAAISWSRRYHLCGRFPQRKMSNNQRRKNRCIKSCFVHGSRRGHEHGRSAARAAMPLERPAAVRRSRMIACLKASGKGKEAQDHLYHSERLEAFGRAVDAATGSTRASAWHRNSDITRAIGMTPMPSLRQPMSISPVSKVFARPPSKPGPEFMSAPSMT